MDVRRHAAKSALGLNGRVRESEVDLAVSRGGVAARSSLSTTRVHHEREFSAHDCRNVHYLVLRSARMVSECND